MDEPTLTAFLALCDTENTRDAAAELGVNQSNVSRALARLEADLGAELFTRHGRRLQLNRAGAAFRSDAAAILQQIDSGRRHLRQLTAPGGLIRLGFLQSLARSGVPPLVEAHRRRWPGARFELRQGFAQDLFGWIDDDRLDVAMVTPPAASRGSIAWRRILDQRLCVAVPRRHRLASRTMLGASDLDGEDFIAFSRTTEIRAVIDGILMTEQVSVTVAFESSEMDTIRGLVGAGLGVAILPEPTTTDEADPVFVPLEPPRSRSLGLAFSAERTATAGVRDFLESVHANDPPASI